MKPTVPSMDRAKSRLICRSAARAARGSVSVERCTWAGRPGSLNRSSSSAPAPAKVAGRPPGSRLTGPSAWGWWAEPGASWVLMSRVSPSSCAGSAGLLREPDRAGDEQPEPDDPAEQAFAGRADRAEAGQAGGLVLALGQE